MIFHFYQYSKISTLKIFIAVLKIQFIKKLVSLKSIDHQSKDYIDQIIIVCNQI